MMNRFAMLLVTNPEPAEPPNWEIVRQAFRHEDVSSPFAILHGVLVVAGLLLVCLLIAAVARWVRQERFRTRPVQIFHRLANELGLPRADQWLLIRIAHRLTLPTPLMLLLSTATLRHHANRYAQTLPARSRARLMTRVATIDANLFGS